MIRGTITEIEAWSKEAAEIVGKNQPMVHKERFCFNYGVHMGVEIAKIKAIERLTFIANKMADAHRSGQHNFKAEIKLISDLIEYHRHMGEGEIEVDTGT